MVAKEANPDPLNNQVFQLYNLNSDFSQADDVAAQHPDKVAEMRKMFVAEATALDGKLLNHVQSGPQ